MISCRLCLAVLSAKALARTCQCNDSLTSATKDPLCTDPQGINLSNSRGYPCSVDRQPQIAIIWCCSARTLQLVAFARHRSRTVSYLPHETANAKPDQKYLMTRSHQPPHANQSLTLGC